MQEDEVIYEMSEITEDVLIIEEPIAEVIDVEVFEAFQAPTAGDSFNHALLTNREIHDAHPITAITRLREELDSIEALQTVYSDKKGNADYYEWADGLAFDENGVGYFVALNQEGTISICAGDDIFGVIVDNAAFVGGQDDIARDAHYGLVATSGVVYVRRELDVAEGDYVVSNSRGMAKKTSSNCGYKVVATRDINGVPHATIRLNISADQINSMGTEIQELDSRMGAAETNIVSAVNVANQAYQKVTNIDLSNLEMSNKVNSALDTVGRLEGDVTDMGTQVLNSAVISAQAKAIAESAVTSAESLRNEATVEANKALDETSKLRKELEDRVSVINDNIDASNRYIDQTKEKIDTLTTDLQPLSRWESMDGTKSGYNGFVAQSNENSTELALVSKYEYKDSEGNIISEGMAGLISQVEKNKSEIALIVSFDQEDSEGVAALVERVSDHDAQLQTLTSWKTSQTEVVNNISQKANRNEANIEIVSSWRDTVKDDVSSISSIRTTANKNEASIEAIAEWQNDTDESIAGIQTTVGSQGSTIKSLTSWQDATDIAMARIEQKADANGAYIQSTVSNMDKYSVGPYSQAYGFTLEQATNILEEDMIYVSTTAHSENYEYTDSDGKTQILTRSFTPQYLYKWGVINGQYRWITVDKNYVETTEVNTSAKAVYFTTIEPAVSGNFGYWYTDGDNITGTTGTYEPYTLYKWASYVDEGDVVQHHWVPVATLAGNVSNRAISQIRQDANSIAFEVTNPRGSFAGMKAELLDAQSRFESLTAWKNGEDESKAIIYQETDDDGARIVISTVTTESGKGSEARLVLTANDDGSALCIDADNINLTGKISIGDFDTDTASKLNNSVASTVIEYALSDGGDKEDEPTSGWSTVTPTWEAGKYVWQRTIITYTDTNKNPTITTTCIQGAKGVDGEDGSTPVIAVGENGNWYVDGEDTGTKAQGENGTDGSSFKIFTTQYSESQSTIESWLEKNDSWNVNESTADIKAGDSVMLRCYNKTKEGYCYVTATVLAVLSNNRINVYSTGLLDKGDAGAPGRNGENGISVTAVITQYCVSTSNTNIPDSGWTDNFDAVLKTYYSNKKANPSVAYYIWSQECVEYSSGGPTYSTATVNSASSVIASWCDENDQTKINGGNIATGTITAKQIASKSITADKLAVGAISADTIDVTDLNAFNATLAGWNITNDRIDKQDVSGNSIVGMSSGNTSYSSLVNEDTESPIRFYAGAYSDPVTKIEPLVLTGEGIELTKTIHLNEADRVLRRFAEAKCLTTTQTHNLISQQSVMIRAATELISISGTSYYGYYTYRAIPVWASSVTIQEIQCSNDKISAEYLGNGQIRVKGTSSQKNGNVTGTVTLSYSCVENLRLTTSWGDEFIKVSLVPWVTDGTVEYPIDIEYTTDFKNQNFMVLEDGSLYANNAKLSGGTIAGLKIEENRIVGSDADASALIIDGSGIKVDGSNVAIQVGDISLAHNKDAGDVILRADSHFILQGASGASLDVMRSVDGQYGDLCIVIEKYLEDVIQFGIKFAAEQPPMSELSGTILYVIRSTLGTEDSGEFKYKVYPGGDWEITPDKIVWTSWYGAVGEYIDTVRIKRLTDREYTEYKIPLEVQSKVVSNSIHQYQTSSNKEWYMVGNLIPDNSSEYYDLGKNNNINKWNYIYTFHELNGSDRKIKDNILNIPTDFSAQLINGLVPKSYTLRVAKTPRVHYGFIAQEVEELLYSLGTSPDEVGIVCKSKPGEPDSEDNHYSLNYTNLIAPMVSVIQQLSRRVEALENKINTTQND